MKPKIAIFGNQHMNLGHAIAADLALAGHEVNILDLPEYKENIEQIKKLGGIHVSGNTDALTSGKTGFAKIGLITTVPEEALRDADVIFVDVPATEFETRVTAIAPFIKNGAVLHFTYYGYWPSLRVAPILKEAGKENVILTECPSALYFARGKDGYLNFTIKRSGVPLSVFPGKKNNETFALLNSLLPSFVPAKNILETNFMNLNMIWHASIALLNVAYFDRVKASGEDTAHFYGIGITEHTGILTEAQDREREAVCRFYGVPYVPFKDLIKHFCKGTGRTMAEAQCNCNFVKSSTPFPVDTWAQWIKWDMPLALVPLISLADLAGIPMPIHRGLVHIFGAILGTDFWKTGLTLDKLGLAELSPEDIIKYVTEE